MPVLHLFPDWNAPITGTRSAPIWAYTNAAEVGRLLAAVMLQSLG